MLADEQLRGGGHLGCGICQDLNTLSVRPVMNDMAHEIYVGLFSLRGEEIMDGKFDTAVMNSFWALFVPYL